VRFSVRELKNVAERIVLRRAGRTLEASDVSREITPMTARGRREGTPYPAGTDGRRATDLYRRITEGHESFWSVVQGPYTAHDLTRDDVRSVVSRGLLETQRNYNDLVRVLNMDSRGYKWMVNFVRKHVTDPPTRSTCPEPAHQSH
jgi:DNA-binding NtrC family response regulator